jgi:uncharacterized hydrophobic protein (TIGR00271 family)
VLRLDCFVPSALVEASKSRLETIDGVRHVWTGSATSDGLILLSAEIEVSAADDAIGQLAGIGIASEDLTLWRVPGIQPLGWMRRVRSTDPDTQVWAEIVGRADEHAQLAASYFIFMISAGMIAGIGVLTASAVLLVGAMAISPDLLPISATAIGIVERRPGLALRALRVLMIGLGTAALAAFAATVLLRLSGQISDDLVLAETTMGAALTHIGPGSLMVAAIAGVAGMLAFERPGGAAVGVAISVTTIPAAAYVGAALGMGRDDPMWGALVVLLSNVTVLLAAGSATLALQRHARRRRGN